jgi:hypothetical protein
MRRLIALIALLAAMSVSKMAVASEGSVFGGPIGGTDIRNAYLPGKPGFYLGVADVYGHPIQLYGDYGQSVPGVYEDNLKYDELAASLTYVYPFKLSDGTIASTVQVGYSPYTDFSINNKHEYIVGWLDPYLDVLKWSRYLGSNAAASLPAGSPKLPYGLTVELAYSMIVPLGTYNVHQYTSGGHNVFFIIPNAAATYLTAPNALGDGLELSGHVFVDYSLKNSRTEYSSGTIVDLDYAISERTGRWQYGVTGCFAYQTGPDRKDGQVVQPAGKYFVSDRAGGVVAFNIPSLGASVKLKALFPLEGSNTITGPQFVLSYGMKI